jgi:hypothetical protein
VGTFSVTLKTPGNPIITSTDTTSTNPTIAGASSPITTRGLTVTSFTPAANGFSASFSKPFVPADISLYGPGNSTVQDVTLVGAASGPISGTLVIDPSNTALTFHATASSLTLLGGMPILPDDTYTATFVSGSGFGGFHDALNAALDGGNSGGQASYTTTFTTHYEADKTPILGMPDFARGPDATGPIKVPNAAGHGIPITLYNASKVTGVIFSLDYDPALLSISGASNSDATDPASSLTLLDAHAHGANAALFEYKSTTPLSGTIVLGDILAMVPASAASNYKAKELLQLQSIAINGVEAPQAVGASGLRVNAYLGDVTGNGTIDGLDVATASAVARGAATGFAAFGLLDPAIVGDPADDISVDAGDISTLAAFTARVPTPAIPAIPTGLTITPVGADPTLSLGESQKALGNEKGRKGDGENGRLANGSFSPFLPISLSPLLSFTVPVLLDHSHPPGSSGITEAILALRYDPSILNVSADDITLGSLPGLAGWQLASAVDQASGQIGIVLYSTSPIAMDQAGSLVNITFHVRGGTRRAGERSLKTSALVQLVSSVTVSGQEFTTQLDDGQGALVLSPGVDQLAAPGLAVLPLRRKPPGGSA